MFLQNTSGFAAQAQPGFAVQPQPQFGVAVATQQPQQGGGQWVYVQSAPFPAAQPVWGYLQQPQQGQAQTLQLAAQPSLVGQWGYAQQPQAALAQVAYAQPRPEVASRGGQFAGAFEALPRLDVPQTRRGPKNYARSDERLRELICERLLQDMSIDASDVSIEVREGRVTVAGTVPHRHMKHAIEDVIDGCWGVQDVENDMRVQFAPEMPNPLRDAGSSGQAVGQTGGGFAGL